MSPHDLIMTDDRFDEALAACHDRRWTDALPLLQEAAAALRADTSLTPDTRVKRRVELLFHLALAHDALGETVAALEALRDLLELDDAHARGWNNLGVICARLGRFEEARDAFERAYRLDPSNASVLVSLGSVCLKMSDPGSAREFLDLALAIDPGHPAAHANLALTLALFGRIEEAEEELRLAALHGYTEAARVESVLDRMKEHRARITARLAAGEGMEEDVDAAGHADAGRSGEDTPEASPEARSAQELPPDAEATGRPDS